MVFGSWSVGDQTNHGSSHQGGEEFWNIPYEVKYGVSIAKPIFVEGVIWYADIGMDHGQYSSVNSKPLCWSEEEGIRGLVAQPLFVTESFIYWIVIMA